MTVKQLIEVLKREDQEAEVLLGLTNVENARVDYDHDFKMKYDFVHFETKRQYSDGFDEYGADYDGMSKYTSKDSKIIVLRPSTHRIKVVS